MQRMALFAACLVVIALAGCQLNPAPGLIACPLPSNQQSAEVLEVVPLGTEREEVLERLKKAGIAGNFGDNESIFYCDVWDRDAGPRWHINVVLLFDEDGKLYATRPAVNEPGPKTTAPELAE